MPAQRSLHQGLGGKTAYKYTIFLFCFLKNCQLIIVIKSLIDNDN